VLVKDGEVFPIDYANACPDVAVTSLHYYFPWAMRALVKWTVFCLVTGRRPGIDLATRGYFDVGDREDLSYEQKLAEYRARADRYFDVEHYRDFCDAHLSTVDEQVHDWIASPGLRPATRRHRPSDLPRPEQERFLAHFRGLLSLWAGDQAATS